MIQWSLTLSGSQIAVLKALKHREFGKPWEGHPPMSHWITGARGLIREGLIEHRETLQFIKPRRIVDPTRSGQFLTPRGCFILEAIEQDLEKFLSEPRRKTKRPNAA